MLHTLLKDVAPMILDNAPIIASVLTGSPLAGMALKLIGNAFGVDSANPDDIVESIKKSDNPESILQTLEHKNASWLQTFSLIKLPQSIELSFKIVWPNEGRIIQ